MQAHFTSLDTSTQANSNTVHEISWGHLSHLIFTSGNGKKQRKSIRWEVGKKGEKKSFRRKGFKLLRSWSEVFWRFLLVFLENSSYGSDYKCCIECECEKHVERRSFMWCFGSCGRKIEKNRYGMLFHSPDCGDNKIQAFFRKNWHVKRNKKQVFMKVYPEILSITFKP